MQRFGLFLIVVLAFLLRFVGLSTHPAGFTPDEASFGYDAYSLINTGKDQWGNEYPLTFKSFGDYKLPLYTYLSIPSVAVFGLTEFAVRLPNVIIGTGAVVATYLLVKQSKLGNPLFASVLVALSPWHIPMSRGAFEANLTTFLLPLGIFAFLKGLKNNKYYLLSAFFLGLNLFSYHSARIVTPLIVMCLIFIYRKNLKRSVLSYASLGIFIIFSSLALINMLGVGGGRISTSSIFSEAGYSGAFVERHQSVLNGLPNSVAFVFNNKFIYSFQTFVENYLSYFSPTFLFSNGPAEGTYGMMPGFGVLYWFELLFLIFFVLMLVKNGFNKETKLLAAWILISPVPAALSLGPGYAANRAIVILPALLIAISMGGSYFFSYLKKYINITYIKAGFTFILLISVLIFCEQYFFQQPLSQGKAMLMGTRDTFTSFDKSNCSGSQVIVDKSISEAHIYVAFYSQYDPGEYQKEARNWNFEELGFKWVDQLPEYQLGNYKFKTVDIKNEGNISNNATIITSQHDAEVLPAYETLAPDGKTLYQHICI